MSHYQGTSDAEQRLDNEWNAVDRLSEKIPKDENREKQLGALQIQLEAVQKVGEDFRNTQSPPSPSELKENLIYGESRTPGLGYRVGDPQFRTFDS